jgi:hypothetical protein
MKRTLCNHSVKNPWNLGIRDSLKFYEVTSYIYKDQCYYIAELPQDSQDSYLYYFELSGLYYAFNNLAGFNKNYINLIDYYVKYNQLPEESIRWIVQRGGDIITTILKDQNI